MDCSSKIILGLIGEGLGDWGEVFDSRCYVLVGVVEVGFIQTHLGDRFS